MGPLQAILHIISNFMANMKCIQPGREIAIMFIAV